MILSTAGRLASRPAFIKAYADGTLEKNRSAHPPAVAEASAAPLAHNVTWPNSSSRPRPQADLASAGTATLNMVGRVPSIDSQ